MPAWREGQNISPSAEDLFLVRIATFLLHFLSGLSPQAMPLSRGSSLMSEARLPDVENRVLISVYRVPKELISRFVKICPTCKTRRGSNSNVSPPISPKNTSSVYSSPQSPGMISSPVSRRDSLLSRHSSIFPSSPVSANIYGSHYQGSQWFSSPQYDHNSGASHPGSSNSMSSNPSMANMNQNGLPMSYSSEYHNGSVSSHRSYPNGYETASNYSQNHNY
jgi:hypothetical protein